MDMQPSAAELDARLAANAFEYYAHVHKIQAKEGGPAVPLVLNQSQAFMERMADQMLEEVGFVRLLALKARQVGLTTWINGRFLRKISTTLGRHVFVLGNDDETSTMIRDRVLYMIEHAPEEYRPKITGKPANRIKFGLQESGYIVATAGSDVGPGRGETIQYFHGDEVSRWPNPEEHRAGAMQTVAVRPGTEIILCSTSTGPAGMFYEMCMDAMAGKSLYRLAFIPWWWDDEYRMEGVEADLSREEAEYAELWELDEAQAAWFHFKNRELGSDNGRICLLMKQEYPSTPAEAFEADDSESFISSISVSKARRSRISLESQYDAERESILGVDVGRTRDPSFLCDRLGRVAGQRVYEEMESTQIMDVANRIVELIGEFGFDYVFVDLGRDGVGVVDRLRELGFGRMQGVFGVEFGSGAENPSRHLNKRVEMHALAKDWLVEPGGARIPDDNKLQGEICAVREVPHHTSAKKLERKEEVKKRLGGKSPNKADAFVLTFGGGPRVRGPRVSQPTGRELARRRRQRSLRRQTSWMAR